MSRTNHVQFNVGSAFARQRAHALAKQTGMTATQVVEDALRGYVPPGVEQKTGRLVRRGPILVRPAEGAKVSFTEAEAALNAVRAGTLTIDALIDSNVLIVILAETHEHHGEARSRTRLRES